MQIAFLSDWFIQETANCKKDRAKLNAEGWKLKVKPWQWSVRHLNSSNFKNSGKIFTSYEHVPLLLSEYNFNSRIWKFKTRTTVWPQRVSYWPRRQSPCIREVNFAIAEKMSIFQEHGSQGIAEKYARDCRNFVEGPRNTRRSLGAQSLHEILKWKEKSYLNENKSYSLIHPI